jgi:hypothetical protein
MTRFVRARCHLTAAVVAAIAAQVPATPAGAAGEPMPPVIDRLYKEPTTLFDMDMKRLRSAAFDAAARMTAPSERTPTSRVWYRVETQSIEIRFEVVARVDQPSPRLCQETRTRLLTDVFSIGRTAYSLNLSRAERIRRRLGLIFAHEPLTDGKEVIAVGQSLAEHTFLEVAYVDGRGATLQSCRAAVAATEPQ